MQPAPDVTHPVLNSSHAAFVVAVVLSVQTLAAHFPPVPALHLPSDPISLRQFPSSVYDVQLANLSIHPTPVDLQPNYTSPHAASVVSLFKSSSAHVLRTQAALLSVSDVPLHLPSEPVIFKHSDFFPVY